MLNHRYLISAFSTSGHPLRRELAALSGLNSPKIVREFNVVEDYNLEPVRSVYEYPLEALLHMPEINDEAERELSSISKDCYQTVVPLLVFFTDGSKGEAGTGFGVYQLSGGEISFRLWEPSGVFTSELSTIFMALVQIRDHHPGKFIILSYSMSSLRALQTREISPRTHSSVYEIKEAS
jgi:hypothetical protein